MMKVHTKLWVFDNKVFIINYTSQYFFVQNSARNHVAVFQLPDDLNCVRVKKFIVTMCH